MDLIVLVFIIDFFCVILIDRVLLVSVIRFCVLEFMVMDLNLLVWNIFFFKWNFLVYERVKKCFCCCGIRSFCILMYVFNLFGVIRVGFIFWGIWVEVIIRIFLVL